MIGKEILGYRIDEKIGSGGFGTVYKVSKNNVSGTYVRALKHITLPTKKQYISVLNSMGGDYAKADSYFEGALKDIVSEIQILNSLSESGVSNIVKYYENDILVTDAPKTYDIYILMEYLTPYTDYLETNNVTVKDVIILGKHILTALKACHEKNIIHRDIKDDNIFVGEGGIYKLGDFGVAKALKDKDRAESVKGTPNFIAPEVYLGKGNYDNTVDLYSLGIVLYRLLNKQRNPFMPSYPIPYNTDDEDKAFEERMSGKKPELPLCAKNQLGEVVVKAICNPKNRFCNAQAFLTALEDVEKAMSEEQLKEVVCKAISTDSLNKINKTKDKSNISSQETIGCEYLGNKTVNDGNGDRHLFDTFASDSKKSVMEEIAVSISTEETESIVKQTKPIEKKVEDTIYKPIITVPEKQQELNEKGKGMKEVLNRAKTKQIITFIAPVVLLFLYVAFYVILIPAIYGKAISFFSWLFADVSNILKLLKDVNNILVPSYVIILLVILQYILLGAFCASIYFLAKQLHKPNVVQNEQVKYNNKTVEVELINILSTVKSSSLVDAQLINNLNFAINSLKFSKAFGYSKEEQVIQVEKNICALIDETNEMIANGLENYAERLKEKISLLKQNCVLREQIIRK